MFRFAHIEYLNLLYLIPVLAVLIWYANTRQVKLMNRFANKALHKVLSPFRSTTKLWTKSVLTLMTVTLLIFALANPQVGAKIEEVKQVGIDVFIILDVSLSMTAEDIKPSRLEKAKFEISKLINRLRGDRIGLIVFSGNAYVQFPLTTDYAAANLFLSAVDVSSVPQPGTAIGPALQLAMSSFPEESQAKRAMVVITDGEDHEGDLNAVIQDANEKEIAIYAIGLGSPSGVPIPLYSASGQQKGYKKDRQGNVVLTKLDETTLQELTRQGNGSYYRATNSSDELEKIYNDLSRIEETEYGATRVTEYEDRYYWFLIPAFLILLSETLISSRKSRFFVKLENRQ
ncbi:MAG: membrane protein [Melioribacteraceae bacterium]|nr:MAG: membrane protein [Melioribacteraceae bacterium]